MNQSIRWTPAMTDRLCELIETDEYSFGAIARVMGLNRDQVTSRWRVVRKKMGAQAV